MKTPMGTDADYTLARTYRGIALLVVMVPLLGTATAAVLAIWEGHVSWIAIGLLVCGYTATVIGVETGFHRYFSHRSFKCGPRFRITLAILGSAAGEGPVLYWATIHRRHHRYADAEGDPHTPVGGGPLGVWHAHAGWLFEPGTYQPGHFAPDLIRDPSTMFAHRFYALWMVAGIAIPVAIGLALGGLAGARDGLLWGGFVRLFTVHQFTWSINSLCHLVGTRPFATRDRSHNLWWLALPTFGGAWHNNHHAFPASATNDLTFWQLDPSAWFIRVAEILGLVWDVRGRVSSVSTASDVRR